MKNKKQKIKYLLNLAMNELNKYKKTRRFSNLSQACEKTWVAFTLAIEYIANEESHGIKDTERLSYKYNYGELFQSSKYLHVVHYEGYPTLSDEDIINDITRVNYGIKKMIVIS